MVLLSEDERKALQEEIAAWFPAEGGGRLSAITCGGIDFRQDRRT
jgi:hypothetical protein